MGNKNVNPVSLSGLNSNSTRRHFLGNFLRAGALASVASLVPEGLLLGAERNPVINNRNEDPWVLVPIPGVSQKPLIIVWGQGGPSHLDLFDPKPDAPAEYRGPFQAIDTSVSGVRFTELLPEMASMANELRIVRCISGRQTEHGEALVMSTTGSPEMLNDKGSSLFNSPKFDSAQVKLSQELMRRGLGLILLNSNPERQPYGGLQPTDRRTITVQCDFNHEDLFPSPLGRVADLERVTRILELRAQFDSDSENRIYGEPGRRVDEVYSAAQNVLGKNFSNAFDITRVSKDEKERAGNSPAGNSAIVAANLVKSGAGLVILNMGFFDNHNDIAKYLKDGFPITVDDKTKPSSFLGFFTGGGKKTRTIPGLGPSLDKVLKYLKDEVGDRAVIVFAGEFGRTPRMGGSGRDHWPNAYTSIMMGAGVAPAVIGETDSKGEEVASRERYGPETILESAINAAGYMRVKLRAGVLTDSPERFPTQRGFEDLPKRGSEANKNSFLARSKMK